MLDVINTVCGLVALVIVIAGWDAILSDILKGGKHDR